MKSSSFVFPRLLALALLITALASRASGATKTWTGADGGFWAAGLNWSGGLPVIGDDVVLGTQSAATASVTANFNVTLTGAGLNSLLINSTGITGTFTLSQTVASTMIAVNETIGSSISGNVYTQSAGTNSVTNTLTLGLSAGSGTYNLSGTGILSAVNETIGSAGTGAFTQSAGTNTINGGSLLIGNSNTTTASTYTLSGGTLTLASGASVSVGNTGRASFSQSAGTMNFTGATPGSLILAAGLGTNNNTYTLAGTGQITNPSKLTVGQAGTATFTQTGGTISLGNASNTGNLFVGDQASSNGTYNLSATTGTGSIATDNVTIGNAGTGAFNQSGGSLTVANTFNLASNPGSSGAYTLTGGTLNVGGTATGTIGGIGTAVFTQSAGNANFSLLTVATSVSGFTASGTYNLNGSGQLNAGSINVGFNSGATGVVNQSGGTNTLTGLLQVGVNGGSSGAYNLSGGSISAPNENMGVNNSGGNMAAFVQTGGSNTVTGTGVLSLGVNGASNGSYFLDASNGASTLNTYAVRVGEGGTGVFTQNGGTHNAAFGITIARNGGSSGTYTLGGGNLNIGTGGPQGVLVVGGGGINGTFNQTGGAVSITGTNIGSGGLVVANTLGFSGTYNQSGGTLTTTYEFVGNGGNGSFVQTGGTHIVNGTNALIVGSNGGSTGSFTLNSTNGAAVLTANAEVIGFFGTGTVSQAAGTTHTVQSTLWVGYGGGSTGTFNQTGGALGSGTEVVGYAGGGTFNQSGGTNTSNLLTVGALAGSNGTYNLSGSGILNVNQAANVITIGGAGTGLFNLTGGTLNGRATSGGVMTVPGGTLNQSGGTLNGYVTNSGTFAYSGGAFNGTLENTVAGIVNLSGAFAAGAGVLNNGTITITPGGSLGAGVGVVLDNENALVLAGGALSGAGQIVNNGSLTGFGTIGGTGGFTNNFSVAQGAGLLVLSNSGANVNNGTITLAPARQVQLVTALTNAATLNLNSGGVTGAGTLTNSPGGTISGPGTISAPLVNSGVIAPGSGTLNISGAWTNTGLVELGGITSNLVGGTITNTGSIQGVGNIGSAINNTSGVIEALGGTLALGGNVTNSIPGTLAASTGNKLIVSPGLTTNSGLINLTGGTFDNNNHALTNAGQISGYGTFRTGGTGLTNAGSVTFTGGVTTVNGNVTNNVGQMIRVSYNPATFTGNVVNNGIFKTTSTTTTFAGTFTNNGTFVSDPATQYFGNLSIGSAGALQGGVGDVFVINGNLTNMSLAHASFDIAQAQITLASGAHDVTWSAADRGPTTAGFTDNFVVGTFELRTGATMSLLGAYSAFGANALYVHTLALEGGLGQLANIHSNGLNIYYDGGLAENSYLAWGTYALPDGGLLAPVAGVPEPGTYALIALGALALAGVRRWKR